MTHESTDDLPDGVVSRKVDSDGVIYYWDAAHQLHNPDGPACLFPDKFTFWMVTGRDPSEKSDWWFGYQVWFRHGQSHRTDGPAVVRGDGGVEYWIDGKELTESEFHQHYLAQQGPLAKDSPS